MPVDLHARRGPVIAVGLLLVIWLGALVPGCARQAGERAPTPRPAAVGAAPGAGGPMEPQVFTEKITVVNETAIEITAVRCTASADDQPDVEAVFGPVAPGGRASGELQAYRSGSFSVVAEQTMEGVVTPTRPFKAVLSPGDVVTPVTLTLRSIPWGSSGTMSLWQGVEWEPPPGHED